MSDVAALPLPAYATVLAYRQHYITYTADYICAARSKVSLSAIRYAMTKGIDRLIAIERLIRRDDSECDRRVAMMSEGFWGIAENTDVEGQRVLLFGLVEDFYRRLDRFGYLHHPDPVAEAPLAVEQVQIAQYLLDTISLYAHVGARNHYVLHVADNPLDEFDNLPLDFCRVMNSLIAPMAEQLRQDHRTPRNIDY